jgi:hypothetical protein
MSIDKGYNYQIIYVYLDSHQNKPCCSSQLTDYTPRWFFLMKRNHCRLKWIVWLCDESWSVCRIQLLLWNWMLLTVPTVRECTRNLFISQEGNRSIVQICVAMIITIASFHIHQSSLCLHSHGQDLEMEGFEIANLSLKLWMHSILVDSFLAWRCFGWCDHGLCERSLQWGQWVSSKEAPEDSKALSRFVSRNHVPCVSHCHKCQPAVDLCPSSHLQSDQQITFFRSMSE